MTRFEWAVGGLILIVVSLTAASAHDWYPPDCCSGRDCAPVPSENVRLVPGGFQIGVHFVPHFAVRSSPDSQYHLCTLKSVPPVLRCFFAPRPAS